MQLVDIAVASGYAAICLSLIVLMNPVAPREAAVEAAAQARLDSAILAYVQDRGLPFLATSPQAAICDSASRSSNATLTLDVLVDGVSCGSVRGPTTPLAGSSITLMLPGRTLLVEAWLARQ